MLEPSRRELNNAAVAPASLWQCPDRCPRRCLGTSSRTAVAGSFLRTRVRASGDAQRQQAQLALQGGRAPQKDPADAGRSEGRAGAMLREVFDGHNYLGHNYIGTGRRDASGGVPEPSATRSLVEDVPLTGLSPTP